MKKRQNDLRIAPLLAERGISVAQLAKMMDRNYISVWKIVTGNPTYYNICEVAKALGVHVRDLMPLREQESAQD